MAQLCVCGHGREWHERCSKCNCPFFLPAGADSKSWLHTTWKSGMKDRARREKGRA